MMPHDPSLWGNPTHAHVVSSVCSPHKPAIIFIVYMEIVHWAKTQKGLESAVHSFEMEQNEHGFITTVGAGAVLSRRRKEN